MDSNTQPRSHNLGTRHILPSRDIRLTADIIHHLVGTMGVEVGGWEWPGQQR